MSLPVGASVIDESIRSVVEVDEPSRSPAVREEPGPAAVDWIWEAAYRRWTAMGSSLLGDVGEVSHAGRGRRKRYHEPGTDWTMAMRKGVPSNCGVSPGPLVDAMTDCLYEILIENTPYRPVVSGPEKTSAFIYIGNKRYSVETRLRELIVTKQATV